jgi:hypothetical protein
LRSGDGMPICPSWSIAAVLSHLNLLRLSRSSECLGRRAHGKRLMRTAVVVEADTVADDSARMLDALEAMAVNTRPLSDLSRNSCSTRPHVLNLAIRACSRAALALVALPERDRCQPRSPQLWPSISDEDKKTIRGIVFPTDASEAHPTVRPRRGPG